MRGDGSCPQTTEDLAGRNRQGNGCAGDATGAESQGGLWKSRNGLPTKVVPKQSQGGGLEVNRQESGAGVPMQWPWETAWLEVEQREVGQR